MSPRPAIPRLTQFRHILSHNCIRFQKECWPRNSFRTCISTTGNFGKVHSPIMSAEWNVPMKIQQIPAQPPTGRNTDPASIPHFRHPLTLHFPSLAGTVNSEPERQTGHTAHKHRRAFSKALYNHPGMIGRSTFGAFHTSNVRWPIEVNISPMHAGDDEGRRILHACHKLTRGFHRQFFCASLTVRVRSESDFVVERESASSQRICN